MNDQIKKNNSLKIIISHDNINEIDLEILLIELQDINEYFKNGTNDIYVKPIKQNSIEIWITIIPLALLELPIAIYKINEIIKSYIYNKNIFKRILSHPDVFDIKELKSEKGIILIINKETNEQIKILKKNLKKMKKYLKKLRKLV